MYLQIQFLEVYVELLRVEKISYVRFGKLYLSRNLSYLFIYLFIFLAAPAACTIPGPGLEPMPHQ